MSDFMDMLKAKWKSGEMATQGNPVRAGDVIIAKFSESEYRIVDNSHLLTGKVPFEYRVLERAVQKPDWADAPAVRITVDGEHHYVLKTDRVDKDEPDIYGYDDNGVAWYYDVVDAEVVPLVPKEITAEMVEKAAIILYGQKTSPDFGSYEHRWNEASLVQKIGHRDMARAILEGSL